MHKIIRSFIFAGLIAVPVSTIFAQHATDKNTAAKLITSKKSILKTTDDAEQRLILTQDLATLSYTAGDMTKAAYYAKDLLNQAESIKENWDYGNAIHAANLVLGRVALAAGDLDEAKEFLLTAGRTPGSPQLDSFGPDMLFAKELLEKGEKGTVVAYFALCSKFWKIDDGRLVQWKATVEKDEIPNFGPNVRYFF